MKVGVLPRNLILSMVMGMGAIASSLALAEYPTAGVTPDQRPQGAPVITQVTHDSQWMKNALRGIDKPYPESLSFLEDQGNWYTPFNHPGATGPYDIRGLHR